MSAALIIMNRQRDLVDRFRDAGATSPGAAKSLSEIGVESSFMFSRMSSRGVFVQAGGDRWWFDAAAWNRYRDRQWKRLVVGAIVIIAVSVVFVALLMMLGPARVLDRTP
jgi:hypothetical protein